MKIEDKYLYIKKSQTWKIRGIYLFGILTWGLVVFAYAQSYDADPFFQFFVTPIIAFLTIYHLVSFGINLFYRQFDLGLHKKLADMFSDKEGQFPTVDVFLPICGEDIKILERTWASVTKINYPKNLLRVYVLDDTKGDTSEHKELASSFGFTHLERPNKGEMKKAGNLKYAYERTNSSFIVIFDADFCPHEDFLLETLPYMADEKMESSRLLNTLTCLQSLGRLLHWHTLQHLQKNHSIDLYKLQGIGSVVRYVAVRMRSTEGLPLIK